MITTRTEYFHGSIESVVADIHHYEEAGWAVRMLIWHIKGATVIFEREASNG